MLFGNQKPRERPKLKTIPLKDGRWRVSGTDQKTFSEKDERLAVARFRSLTRPAMAQLPVEPVIDELGQLASNPAVKATVTQEGEADGFPLIQFSLHRQVPESEIWAWVREQIITRPQYAATMTGIEQLAYLADLKRPAKAPKAADTGEIYFAKPKLSANEQSRSRLFWGEFVRSTGIRSIREIDHEAVAKYEKSIHNKKLSPRSIHHRYSKIRTILHYCMKRGHHPEDCRKALDVLAMLEVNQGKPLDPKPITKEQFWKIYAVAEKAGDQTYMALMLAALNFAMYSGEVSALEWSEIDMTTGELVTRRPKTDVSRIGVLWTETVEALKALPHHGDRVFYTRIRSYTTFSVLEKWRQYRKAAGLDEIQFGQIRDAAYTIACQNVTLDQAKMLAGHKLGMADHYLRRNPQFVADACKAIREAFFIPEQ